MPVFLLYPFHKQNQYQNVLPYGRDDEIHFKLQLYNFHLTYRSLHEYLENQFLFKMKGVGFFVQKKGVGSSFLRHQNGFDVVFFLIRPNQFWYEFH